MFNSKGRYRCPELSREQKDMDIKPVTRSHTMKGFYFTKTLFKFFDLFIVAVEILLYKLYYLESVNKNTHQNLYQ